MPGSPRVVASRVTAPSEAATLGVSPLMLFSPDVFWPYFAGISVLLVGLGCKRGSMRQVRGIGALILFSPVLVAVAMAVFGADHLTEPSQVANFVPAWMPGRFFWAVFVGVALVAAAVSLASGIWATLATGLLGTMLLGFALLLFLPAWLSAPGNRMLATLLLRDLTLGSAYLAYAVHAAAPSQTEAAGRPASPDWRRGVVTVARLIIAVAVGVYGVLQCRHPEAAPGIPQDGPFIVTLPAWIPAHHLWSYVTGALFIVCAFALLRDRLARDAAAVLGVTTCALIGLAYLPVTIAKAADVEHGLNYLAIHLALAGAFFLLAAAQRKRNEPTSRAAVQGSAARMR
jgi:uncharacterized membrane protein